MAGKLNLELKVGVFVFIALVILVLAIFSIGEVYIFRSGYVIKIYFSFASGMDLGTPVRVAGIEAGEVKDVELTYDKSKGKAKIVLSVWLDEKVKIPRDSAVYVNTLGLIGENYLEIIPGHDYTHLLKDGDTLIGTDPFSQETLMESAHKAALNLDKFLLSLNEVLDEETEVALKEAIHNFRDATASIKVITGRLERGEGKLGAWLEPRKKDIKRREESKD